MLAAAHVLYMWKEDSLPEGERLSRNHRGTVHPAYRFMPPNNDLGGSEMLFLTAGLVMGGPTL